MSTKAKKLFVGYYEGFTPLQTRNHGNLVHKSNCNFFTVKDDLFSEVRVYMSGENTLAAKRS